MNAVPAISHYIATYRALSGREQKVLLGSLALSALSWKLFEQPILSLKSWFPRPGEVPAVQPVEPVATDRAAAQV